MPASTRRRIGKCRRQPRQWPAKPLHAGAGVEDSPQTRFDLEQLRRRQPDDRVGAHRSAAGRTPRPAPRRRTVRRPRAAGRSRPPSSCGRATAIRAAKAWLRSGESRKAHRAAKSRRAPPDDTARQTRRVKSAGHLDARVLEARAPVTTRFYLRPSGSRISKNRKRRIPECLRAEGAGGCLRTGYWDPVHRAAGREMTATDVLGGTAGPGAACTSGSSATTWCPCRLAGRANARLEPSSSPPG